MVRVKSNTPIQYLKGYVEFYRLKFKVTPDVLIPRPETELLVDDVLSCIKTSLLNPDILEKDILVLDLGTGSGNIAISVAKNSQDVRIIGSEVSSPALKIAEKNAKLHGVWDRIEFIESDLIKNPKIFKADYKVLIIVTNLPYIPSERIPYLDSSVKDFEPWLALDGGNDGFGLYRKLFSELSEKKVKFKLLLGEIDYTHGELAVNEALKYFPQAQVEVRTDLSHRQRILRVSTTD